MVRKLAQSFEGRISSIEQEHVCIQTEHEKFTVPKTAFLDSCKRPGTMVRNAQGKKLGIEKGMRVSGWKTTGNGEPVHYKNLFILPECESK